MQSSSNMSAGGESSSEQVTSSQIIAHEDDLAWREYDALDAQRHGRPESNTMAAVPTALSIMRRQRSGSEDVLMARKNMLERNKGEERGEGTLNMNGRFPRVTPPVSRDYTMAPPPPRSEYDRARWEEQADLYYYEQGCADPYYRDYYGYREYHNGGSHHAPMPSFLGDAYRRHQEMGYGAEMGTMRDRYYMNKGGGYRDPISLSDHGPGSRGPNRPTQLRPQQGPAPVPRVLQGQPNISPQRVVSNGRAYQEMDWKQDRLWREDNHIQTSSAGAYSAHQQAPEHAASEVQMYQRNAAPPASRALSVPPRFSSQKVQDSPRSTHLKSKPPLPEPIPHNPRTPKKSVSFNTLQIRTYETILGDNPSCSTGPSLGLGWRYDPSHYTSTIEEYERYQRQVNGCADPRPEDLVLHRCEREAILLNTGYTRQDLAESVRGITKVKNRRRQTVHNLPVAWVEERLEGCRRTLRRWILNKERTRSMYDEWKMQEGSTAASCSGVVTRGILRKTRSE